MAHGHCRPDTYSRTAVTSGASQQDGQAAISGIKDSDRSGIGWQNHFSFSSSTAVISSPTLFTQIRCGVVVGIDDEGKSLLLANLLGSLVDLCLERSIRIGSLPDSGAWQPQP